MTLNSGHENTKEGVKKSKKTSFKAKCKPMKACATGKEKINLVNGQSIPLNQRFVGSEVITYTKVDEIPLKEEDHNSWLDFKKLDEGRPVLTCIRREEQEGKWPINVDHPFVAVIRDFATDAFNAVAHMMTKSNSLCGPEVMSCKYLNYGGFYYFLMTVEGIEAGILGVYEVIVACNTIDGNTSLVRLRLTSSRPSGKIAMMLPHLINLRSKHAAMRGTERDLKAKLKKSRKSIKGYKKKGKMAAELIHLEEEYKAIKENRSILYQQIQSQIPKTWFPEGRRCHPSVCWTGPKTLTTALKSRSISRGHDYYTRTHEHPGFPVMW